MHDSDFTPFPAITLGGPTGDYFTTCPETSCQWAEYSIDSIVNGDGGTGAVVISGNTVPVALSYAGVSTIKLNDDAVLHGIPIRIPATTTQIINSLFERIIHSQKRVFVRIDAAASTSMYVTLRFRVMPLKIVPGQSVTVPPDHMHQMNIEREGNTMKKLAAMGIPQYAQEREGKPE